MPKPKPTAAPGGQAPDKKVSGSPEDLIADKLIALVESRGLSIERARALAYVANFKQKAKKLLSDKEIQVAVNDFVKWEAITFSL
jgi:hypothetical protein